MCVCMYTTQIQQWELHPVCMLSHPFLRLCSCHHQLPCKPFLPLTSTPLLTLKFSFSFPFFLPSSPPLLSPSPPVSLVFLWLLCPRPCLVLPGETRLFIITDTGMHVRYLANQLLVADTNLAVPPINEPQTGPPPHNPYNNLLS